MSSAPSAALLWAALFASCNAIAQEALQPQAIFPSRQPQTDVLPRSLNLSQTGQFAVGADGSVYVGPTLGFTLLPPMNPIGYRIDGISREISSLPDDCCTGLELGPDDRMLGLTLADNHLVGLGPGTNQTEVLAEAEDGWVSIDLEWDRPQLYILQLSADRSQFRILSRRRATGESRTVIDARSAQSGFVTVDGTSRLLAGPDGMLFVGVSEFAFGGSNLVIDPDTGSVASFSRPSLRPVGRILAADETSIYYDEFRFEGATARTVLVQLDIATDTAADVAGQSGFPSQLNDGGQAGQAGLRTIKHAIARDGRLYVHSQARVREIDTSKRIDTLAGGLDGGRCSILAAQAALDGVDLAVDHLGRPVFRAANSIWRYDPSLSKLTPVVGAPFIPPGIGESSAPSYADARDHLLGDVFFLRGVDAQGDLYYTDSVGLLYVVDLETRRSSQLTDSPTSGQVTADGRLVFEFGGTLFITNPRTGERSERLLDRDLGEELLATDVLIDGNTIYLVDEIGTFEQARQTLSRVTDDGLEVVYSTPERTAFLGHLAFDASGHLAVLYAVPGSDLQSLDYLLLRVDLEAGEVIEQQALPLREFPLAMVVPTDSELYVLDTQGLVRVSLRQTAGISKPRGIDPGDRFGAASATAGERFFVGVPADQKTHGVGSVAVYFDDGCLSTLEAVIAPPAGFDAVGFGQALAASGDLLLIGADASGAGSKGLQNALAAAVYQRTLEGWALQKVLDLPPATSASALGINAGTLVVGDGAADAVYLFEPEGEEFIPRETLTGASGSGFGAAVALSGQDLLVGAPDADEARGAAFVFDLSAASAGPRNELTGAAAGDRFGAALALEQSQILVGAPGTNGTGSVFLFDQDAPDTRLNLTTSGLQPGDRFGAQIDVSDSVLSVAAPGQLQSDGQATGATYLFDLDAAAAKGVGNTTQSPLARLAASSGFAAFGDSLAFKQGRLIVGAPDSLAAEGAAIAARVVANLAGLGGLWFDPAAPGDGFNVILTDFGLLTYFYGYDRGGERLWLVSDLIELPLSFDEDQRVALFELENGRFIAPPGDPVKRWGTLSLRFSSNTAGVFELAGGDGSKTLGVRKLASYLPSQSEPSGLWFDPVRPGDGFSVLNTEAGSIVYFYGFTAAGERLWLISDLGDPLQIGTGVIELPMFNAAPTGFYAPEEASIQSWGSLTVDFNDCASATFVLNGRDGQRTWAAEKLAGLADTPCAAAVGKAPSIVSLLGVRTPAD